MLQCNLIKTYRCIRDFMLTEFVSLADKHSVIIILLIIIIMKIIIIIKMNYLKPSREPTTLYLLNTGCSLELYRDH